MNGGLDIALGCVSLAAFIFSIILYTKSQQELFKENNLDWKMKYKDPLERAKRNWYTQLFKLKYKERFPLSGSFLVAFTDRYHRYQMFFKILICAAIVMYRPLFWFDSLIYFVAWGITFTLVFRKG